MPKSDDRETGQAPVTELTPVAGSLGPMREDNRGAAISTPGPRPTGQPRRGARSDSNSESRPTPNGTVATGSGVLLRREARRDELALDTQVYAGILSSVLSAADEELCFGLFAPWGRGKTTLVREVAHQLGSDSNQVKYSTVWFNAWKYRTPHEQWAYLYETLAEGLQSNGILTTIGRVLRANVLRHGMRSIWLSIFALAFALIPIGLKLSIGWAIAVFVGVGILGSLWLLFGLRRTVSVISRLWRDYARMPSHRAHLGLQAAIGEDAEYLLRGWIPEARLAGNSDSSGGSEASRHSKFDWLMLVMSQLAVAGALAYGVRDAPVWGTVLVVVLWVAACVVPVFLARRSGDGTQRVLLVVDDLDRCPPETILEVLESIKLLVEEPAIYQRLQVLVLVDEGILRDAIAQRFLWAGSEADDGVPEQPVEGWRDRLVSSHVDKLFLGYLRMPPMTSGDVLEILNLLPGVEVVQRPPRTAPDPSKLAPTSSTGERSVVSLTADEVAKVHDAIIRLRDAKSGPLISPRFIRNFVFRFQMARHIARTLGIETKPDADLIAKGLVEISLLDGPRLICQDEDSRQLQVVLTLVGLNKTDVQFLPLP